MSLYRGTSFRFCRRSNLSSFTSLAIRKLCLFYFFRVDIHFFIRHIYPFLPGLDAPLPDGCEAAEATSFPDDLATRPVLAFLAAILEAPVLLLAFDFAFFFFAMMISFMLVLP